MPRRPSFQPATDQEILVACAETKPQPDFVPPFCATNTSQIAYRIATSRKQANDRQWKRHIHYVCADMENRGLLKRDRRWERRGGYTWWEVV